VLRLIKKRPRRVYLEEHQGYEAARGEDPCQLIDRLDAVRVALRKPAHAGPRTRTNKKTRGAMLDLAQCDHLRMAIIGRAAAARQPGTERNDFSESADRIGGRPWSIARSARARSSRANLGRHCAQSSRRSCRYI